MQRAHAAPRAPHDPNALGFYARIPPFAAGASVGCMALAEAKDQAKLILPISMGYGRGSGLNCGKRSVD